jgi:hypothetical protein
MGGPLKAKIVLCGLNQYLIYVFFLKPISPQDTERHLGKEIQIKIASDKLKIIRPAVKPSDE